MQFSPQGPIAPLSLTSKNILLRYSLMAGLIALGISLIWFVGNNVLQPSWTTSLLQMLMRNQRMSAEQAIMISRVISITLMIVILGSAHFGVAMVASRKTGRIQTGVLVGLIGGASSQFLILCTAFWWFSSNVLPSLQPILSPDQVESIRSQYTINVILYTFLLEGVVTGLVAGALGGLTGSRMTRPGIPSPFYQPSGFAGSSSIPPYPPTINTSSASPLPPHPPIPNPPPFPPFNQPSPGLDQREEDLIRREAELEKREAEFKQREKELEQRSSHQPE